MFGILDGKRKRRRKVVDHIAAFFAPCFHFYRRDDGTLAEPIRHDKYVLSYMYGVIACALHTLDIQDTAEKGYILGDVYEHFFPGQGGAIMIHCNTWAEQGDEEFMRVLKTGYLEAKKVYESFERGNVEEVLISLIKHLTGQYLR